MATADDIRAAAMWLGRETGMGYARALRLGVLEFGRLMRAARQVMNMDEAKTARAIARAFGSGKE